MVLHGIEPWLLDSKSKVLPLHHKTPPFFIIKERDLKSFSFFFVEESWTFPCGEAACRDKKR